MWFETLLIAPGLHRITEGGMAHAYLVQGDDWAALVDSGYGIGDIAAIVKELTDKPVLVINTHAHIDHVGGNERFGTAFLHQSESLADAAEVAKRFRENVTQDDFSVPFPDGFSPQRYDPRVPEPTHRLVGGEAIDLGGRVLEVLHTPGHTAGSICLLDERNRFLFTGDNVTDRPIQGIGDGVTLADYQQTLRLLAEMSPDMDLILPGHGPSPVPPATLAELAASAQHLVESAFQRIEVGNREALGMTVGRFTFFMRPQLTSAAEPASEAETT
jgi:glyoxylase-like metal-dependent hydrolase (beta-lactamase superfamily II)